MVSKAGYTLWLLALALTLGTAAEAIAPGSEDWAIIDTRATALAATVGKQAAAVDRRIKLARCPETAAIEVADMSSLAVRCAPLGWRVRIALKDAHDGQTGAQTAGPLIRRGEVVRLRVEREGFVIFYSTVANQNGAIGDTITLRGSDPKVLLNALVTGRGQAVLLD